MKRTGAHTAVRTCTWMKWRSDGERRAAQLPAGYSLVVGFSLLLGVVLRVFWRGPRSCSWQGHGGRGASHFVLTCAFGCRASGRR